jgi:hypothetical protein
MTNGVPANCSIHGKPAKTPLLAGIVPRQGVHYLNVANRTVSAPLIADIAIAVASDSTACGLSDAERDAYFR